MSLAVLSIDLEARLASLQSGFDKAGRLSEKYAASMQKGFDGIGATVARLGPLIAATFAGTSILQFTRATIDGLEALNDLSDATGSSVENISALEDVALRTGTSFESFASTLIKFNKVLADAKVGSDEAGVFAKLGLDLAALKSADPSEALRQTAVALARFSDDGDKARVVQKLFGKSVQEAAAFLKELAEQTGLVATVTTQQSEAAERFNKNLLELQKNSLDLARIFSGTFVESINDAASEFRKASKEGQGFVGSFFSALTAEADKNELRILTEQLEAVNKGLAKFRQSGQSKESLSFFGRRSVEQLEEDGKRIRSELERIRGAQTGRRPANEGGGGFELRIGGGDDEKKTKAVASEAERYLDSLKKQLEKTQDLTVVEQALADIREKRLSGSNAAIEKEILALARRLDLLKETGTRQAAQEAFRALENVPVSQAEIDAFRRLEDQAKAFYEATRTPQERLNAQLAEQTKLLESLGPAYEETYNRAVGAAFSRLDDTFKKTKEAEEAFKDLGLTFSSAFEDAVVGGKKLSQVLNSLGDDVLRLLLRKTVTEPATNALSGLFTSFLGSAFGGATGAAAPSRVAADSSSHPAERSIMPA